MASVQRRSPQETATLDLDATLVATNKREALYCYKGPKAYQPLNVYWAEQDLILHSEFRDGNVWAGTDNPRVFPEAWLCYLREWQMSICVRIRRDISMT